MAGLDVLCDSQPGRHVLSLLIPLGHVRPARCRTKATSDRSNRLHNSLPCHETPPEYCRSRFPIEIRHVRSSGPLSTGPLLREYRPDPTPSSWADSDCGRLLQTEHQGNIPVKGRLYRLRRRGLKCRNWAERQRQDDAIAFTSRRGHPGKRFCDLPERHRFCLTDSLAPERNSQGQHSLQQPFRASTIPTSCASMLPCRRFRGTGARG